MIENHNRIVGSVSLKADRRSAYVKNEAILVGRITYSYVKTGYVVAVCCSVNINA